MNIPSQKFSMATNNKSLSLLTIRQQVKAKKKRPGQNKCKTLWSFGTSPITKEKIKKLKQMLCQ